MTSVSTLPIRAFRFFREHGLRPAGGVAVAVSGGADSVALLHALAANGQPVIAAHCNFQLRSAGSEADEAFVRALAEKLSLPFYAVRFDTQSERVSTRESVQVTARRLRYAWLDGLREELGLAYVATAHHADDNAETVLQHVIDGTGLAGLAGIPPVNGRVIRPFLDATKAEILTYLEEHNLSYRTDASNFNTDYTRNRIRLELIPKLRELNPSVVQTLTANAKRWRGAHAVYHQGIETLKQKLVRVERGVATVNIAALKTQASSETVLYEILKDFGFNAAQAEQAHEALDAQAGKTFFSDTHRVVKDRNLLLITLKNEQTFYRLVERNATLAVPNARLEIETIPNTPKINFDTTRYQYLDADLLSFPLTLRPWEKGDYFYPFGLNKKKKLSDYFNERKFSLLDKERQPLLLSRDHVVALPGITVDHRFRVKPTTNAVVKLRYVINER